MASLLDPLTADQQSLVELLAAVFLEHRRWPIFDYVERMLGREHLDAQGVLSTFPASDRLAGGGSYSAVWAQDLGNNRPVKLTVLGLHHSERVRRNLHPPLEGAFFVVLRYFINLYRVADPSPFEIRDVEAGGDEIEELLTREGHKWLTLDALFDLLKHEPATWYGNVATSADGSARWLVTSHVTNYDGVTDIEGYVERLTALAPPPPPFSRAVSSPLSLPAALDYLDAIWRLVPGHTTSLLRLHSVERTAKLALPARSVDELHGRLSALGEVLSGLDVPRSAASGRLSRDRADGDPALKRLRDRLLETVGPDGQDQVNDAIDTLQDIIDLRHGVHHGHSDTRSKAAAAYERLGINYAAGDSAGDWEIIQIRAVEALEKIREELALITR